jgi:YggT family protein
MRAILDIILLLLDLYWWVAIIMIVMSWLFTFNIINAGNQVVDTIWRVVTALTDPILKPIRRMLPDFGGLDLSPLVLFLLIIFIRLVIGYYIYPYVF